MPRPALEEILHTTGCFTLLQALWHRGEGVWSVAAPGERQALAAMAEQFELAEDGLGLSDRYARLFDALDSRYPQTRKLFARMERPRAVVQARLRQHLRRERVSAADTLASAAVYGDVAAEALGELTCLSEATVLRIAGGLRRMNPRRLLSAWPMLAAKAAFRRMDTLPGRSEGYRGAAANDVGVRNELEELVLLYARASERSYLVLLG